VHDGRHVDAAQRARVRRSRRVVAVAGRAATALLVVGFLAVAVAGLAFHLRLSPVLSPSMRPAYSPGDAIITRSVDAGSLHVGDIAVFVPPGESATYAHRITSLHERGGQVVVTTKGDANPAPDPWHATLGTRVTTVVGVVPGIGRVLTWIRSPAAHALAIALIGLVITALGTRALLIQPRYAARPQRG
jgi:signal peptidase I